MDRIADLVKSRRPNEDEDIDFANDISLSLSHPNLLVQMCLVSLIYLSLSVLGRYQKLELDGRPVETMDNTRLSDVNWKGWWWVLRWVNGLV
jgi:hypothetical protein